jgi:hypothetical protein
MSVERETDWIAIEGAYRANILSTRAIGRDNGVSEGAIRKRAKERGWQRDPSSTKREIVKAHFAGNPQTPESPSTRSEPESTQVRTEVCEPLATLPPEPVYARYARTPQRVAATSIADAANQDIEDMESALFNARKALQVAGEYLETQFCGDMETGRMPDPRNLKAIVDANGAAIEQIRRIRGLDNKVGDELEALKLLVTAGWVPDELLVAAFSEYRRLKPAIKTAFSGHFERVRDSGNDRA